MQDKTPLKPELWVERPVESTIELYREWAETYDADLAKRGYHTPDRIADALTQFMTPGSEAILDFGCGTGVSGKALHARGFHRLHGTDITDAMLKYAESKGIYEKLWLSQPGDIPALPGVYDVIVAAGVISLGAAPPETMDQVVAALAPGGLLALSFNDPTLEAKTYDEKLSQLLDSKQLKQLFREHGPHLDDIGMKSDVIVLERL